MTQFQIAQELGYASENGEIDSLMVEIGNMLTAMLKKYGAFHC